MNKKKRQLQSMRGLGAARDAQLSERRVEFGEDGVLSVACGHRRSARRRGHQVLRAQELRLVCRVRSVDQGRALSHQDIREARHHPHRSPLHTQHPVQDGLPRHLLSDLQEREPFRQKSNS